MVLHVATLAGATGINHHISRRRRIVLQLDNEIIEPSFLVVALDIGKLVKLAAGDTRYWNRNAAIGGTIQRAVSRHREICADGLTREARGIDLDRVGSLAFDDAACGDGPIVDGRN